MTDERLPDDLARWPTDPFELLGVNASIDERGLKRAYAKLIRQFKPEHHPQHFIRIREAFEQLLQHIQWKSQFPSTESGDETSDQNGQRQVESFDIEFAGNLPRSKNLDPDAARSNQIHRSTNGTLRSFEEALEVAWQPALKGDAVQSYLQLLNLVPQFEQPCEIYLRLYWLHRLFPDLEPARHHSHWLIIALKRTRFHSAPWLLYCAELKRQPQLAQSTEHQSLLNIAMPSWRLFELLKHRWRAALRVKNWEWVHRDLDLLRGLLKFDSSVTWVQILFQVFDLAAWSSCPAARQIVEETKQELQELSETHAQLHRAFFRYDLLLEVLAKTPIEPLQIVDDEFREFSRDNWHQSVDAPDPQFKAALENWAANPRRILKLLTGFRKHARHLFGHISNIIMGLKRDKHDQNAFQREESIKELIQQFLLSRKKMKYGRFRVELLEFCCHNRITLEEILASFEDWLDYEMPDKTLPFLRTDRPLKVVLHGVFAFWN